MEAPDSGCRYQRAVRQSMNKMMSNRSSVHHVLAGIITEYSHKSWVRPGSYMLGSRFHFFVVKRLFSPGAKVISALPGWGSRTLLRVSPSTICLTFFGVPP